jgi:hypothetical protein
MSAGGPVREPSEPSANGELTATLWLIAVLLAEFLAVVWFFGGLDSA